MNLRLAIVSALFFFCYPIALNAQASNPADSASVEAIIAATYEVISGGAGEERDWDRFIDLFAPEGTLSAVVELEPGIFGRRRVMSPEEYARSVGPNLTRTGFFENEIHLIKEEFGNIAHAFSSYESRRSADDSEPFARGINSFQLMHDGSRWYVVSIYWQAESDDRPIPARYGG